MQVPIMVMMIMISNLVVFIDTLRLFSAGSIQRGADSQFVWRVPFDSPWSLGSVSVAVDRSGCGIRSFRHGLTYNRTKKPVLYRLRHVWLDATAT